MSTRILLAVSCCALLAVGLSVQEERVLKDDSDKQHMYCVRGGQISSYMEGAPCDAYGSNAATRNQTGWNVLSITTNGSVSDEAQAYAAGYLEGYTNAEDITLWYFNLFGPEAQPPSRNLTEWVKRNDKWVRTQVAAKQNSSSKWRFVGLTLQQADGMYQGMVDAGFGPDSGWTHDMFLLVLNFPDVEMIELSQTADGSSQKKKRGPLHCSALVKVADDLSDIFFGHISYESYNWMLRVFKTFTFNFNTVPLAAKTIQFSSYPGFITSSDDFYSSSSGLAVMETSLIVFNNSAIQITPESLLYTYRLTLANRLATSAEEWTQYFVYHNSGTYNNQWMVLDLNRFTPGVQLDTGTFWVLEQAGLLVEAKDITNVLAMGYWPSYNVPYFPSIYKEAGYEQGAIGYPTWFGHNSFRSQLFRQMQGRVHTLADLRYVLQYNDYQNDPLEHMNPGIAIGPRFDLLPPGAAPIPVDPQVSGPVAAGGADCKVGSYKESFLVQEKPTVYAFVGPTPQQEVFSFLTSNATGLNPHLGLPLTYNFTWQTFQYSP